MAILLKPGDVLFESIRVTEQNVAWAGQAICHRGIDNRQDPAEPWNYNVFIKQFEDIANDSTTIEGAVAGLRKVSERLGNWPNLFCVPRFCGFDERSASFLAIYPNIDRRTLRDAFADPKEHSDQTRANLIWRLVECIWHMHENGIAHTDLSPANIMVVEKRHEPSNVYPRIIDFDSASVDGAPIQKARLATPRWHAPEHGNTSFGPVGCPADVFCLALVALTLLTGQHPFEDASSYREAIETGSVQLSAQQFDFSVVDCLTRALSPHPEDRPTIREIASCLKSGQLQLRGYKSDRGQAWDAPAYFRIADRCGYDHVYYQSQRIGPSHLRGSGVRSTRFAVQLGPLSTIARIAGTGAPLRINGHQLGPGPRLLRRGKNLLEVEGVKLELEIAENGG